MTFDILSCRAAADRGRLEEWLHGYLTGGPWANPVLSAGLRRRARLWIGPVLLRLDALERCCGPEADMEYRVDAEAWHRKVTGMARGLTDPTGLPPLVVEWRAGRLSVRDGAATGMRQLAWRAGRRCGPPCGTTILRRVTSWRGLSVMPRAGADRRVMA